MVSVLIQYEGYRSPTCQVGLISGPVAFLFGAQANSLPGGHASVQHEIAAGPGFDGAIFEADNEDTGSRDRFTGSVDHDASYLDLYTLEPHFDVEPVLPPQLDFDRRAVQGSPRRP